MQRKDSKEILRRFSLLQPRLGLFNRRLNGINGERGILNFLGDPKCNENQIYLFELDQVLEQLEIALTAFESATGDDKHIFSPVS